MEGIWTRIDGSDGPLRPRSLLVADRSTDIAAFSAPQEAGQAAGTEGMWPVHRGSCRPAPADSCHVACLVMGQKSKMDLPENLQVFKSQLVQWTGRQTSLGHPFRELAATVPHSGSPSQHGIASQADARFRSDPWEFGSLSVHPGGRVSRVRIPLRSGGSTLP